MQNNDSKASRWRFFEELTKNTDGDYLLLPRLDIDSPFLEEFVTGDHALDPNGYVATLAVSECPRFVVDALEHLQHIGDWTEYEWPIASRDLASAYVVHTGVRALQHHLGQQGSLNGALWNGLFYPGPELRGLHLYFGLEHDATDDCHTEVALFEEDHDAIEALAQRLCLQLPTVTVLCLVAGVAQSFSAVPMRFKRVAALAMLSFFEYMRLNDTAMTSD